MSKTLQTTLHTYSFPSGADPRYRAMVAQINANANGRGHWMNAIPGNDDWRREAGDGERTEPVELETDFVFGNQWNEADRDGKPGRRLFDWYEAYLVCGNARPPHKVGHWLEITPAMTELRRATLKCGYCAHQYGPHHSPPPAGWHCTACLDSEYLQPTDFPLLRLTSVSDQETTHHARQWPPLTDAELAGLMPLYVERQTTGTDSRAAAKRAKQRADVLKKYEQETTNATVERDGLLWLWDHGVSLDNVIYYNHTGIFSFGWRAKVAPEVKAALVEQLHEFPFAYSIEATDSQVRREALSRPA